jgi:DNA-binding winged helix-turn-helix (wHTH) protein
MKLDKAANRVSIDGITVNLTGKETALLAIFAAAGGKVVTKEQMLAGLYGDGDQPEVKILDVFVCKIRRKIRLAIGRDVIRTEWGRGYALN